MNIKNLFLSLCFLFIYTNYCSTFPEFIKISPMKKNSVTAMKQKMKQQLKQIEQLQKKNDDKLAKINGKIKGAAQQITMLEKEFDVYVADIEITSDISRELSDWETRKKNYEVQRDALKKQNKDLIEEARVISNKLDR